MGYLVIRSILSFIVIVSVMMLVGIPVGILAGLNHVPEVEALVQPIGFILLGLSFIAGIAWRAHLHFVKKQFEKPAIYITDPERYQATELAQQELVLEKYNRELNDRRLQG